MVLGSLAFAASSEADGADGVARNVTAKIEAVAEEAFTDADNATEMVFYLAAGGAAASKMTLSSAGLLSPSGGISCNEANITNVGNIALDSISADGVALSIDSNWDAAGVTCSDLGEVTTVDINGGTIDGATIATSDITVGSSKTLNVSGGTLTTSAAQNLAIVQGAASNIDIGNYALTAQTLVADVTIGTAPLTITSTTKVTNLNADKLDDQEGSYYLDFSNFVVDADEISGDKVSGGTIGTVTISQLAGAMDCNSQAMTNANIDTGDIASAVTVNKSPVITLGGDLTGNCTLTSLGNATLTSTIATSGVENTMLHANVISSMDDVTSTDSDYLLLWQATSSALKKVDAGEFRGGGGASLTGNTDNQVVTVTGADAIAGETRLTFDGDALAVTTSDQNKAPVTINGASAQAADLLQLKNSGGNTLFIVDAIGQVGIGESVDPAAGKLLHISGGTTDGNKTVVFEAGAVDGADTNNQAILKVVAGTSANAQIQMGQGTASSTLKGAIKYKSDDTMILRTNSADALTIAAEGDVTFAKAIKPAAPAAATGTSAIVVLDCDTTNHFTITTSNNITGWNFSNASPGQRIIVRVTNGASHTVGFATTGDGDVVYFPGGTEPVLTTGVGAIDVYGFLCISADVFDGFIIGQDIKA
jgi:hypothetical protein